MSIRLFLAAVTGAAIVSLAGCSGGGGTQMPTVPSQSMSSAATTQHVAYTQLMTQTDAVDHAGGFTLTSENFKNGGTIPQLIRGDLTPQCHGSDKSPTLFWSNPPKGTKSFALVLFDPTANFGHWGIYNMRPNSNRLPLGVAFGNLPPYWLQVTNDLGVQGYFGPCPPPGIVHQYIYTIYALNTTLNLPTFPPLPGPTIETLFRAMIGNVIGRADLEGEASF
jgi:Raf kinase inhibitor-like YbhB/YbcL family protein